MKAILFYILLLISFCGTAQNNDNIHSLDFVKSNLSGNWKNENRFKGKIWITTFSFFTDSTGTWRNNRTHSSAPTFIIREQNRKFYISAVELLGGECARREIILLDSKKMILSDPVTKEEFKYKRTKRGPRT